MSDPYVYPETSTLRNLLDIQDSEILRELEYYATRRRGREQLPEGNFDYAHLKAIHGHLFQDVYDWAGQERMVDISKGNSMFCRPPYIEQQSAEILNQLAADHHLKGLTPAQFAERAGHYLCEVNAIHPFREGNGRTQRAFFTLLAARAGHRLEFDRVESREMIEASIAGMHGDEKRMVKVLEQALCVRPREREKDREQRARDDEGLER